MSRKFLTAVDFTKNEIQNAVVQNLGGAPGTPVKGQLYFNSTDNTLYWWDGSQWQSARGGATGFPGYGAVVPETTFGGSSADGVSATVSRSDHKHANPTHAAADHATIPLNSFSAPTADISMGGFKITSLGAPTAIQDAATKLYVDNVAAGLDPKNSVKVASTGNVALTGLQTIDGVVLAGNDRVLLKNQTAPAENGIWSVSSGAWARALDMDNWLEVPSAFTFVEQGTVNADTGWVCTADQGGTLNTTAITWTQFSGGGTIVAGAGMTQSGNTLNVIGTAGGGLTVNADDVGVTWGGNGAAGTVARSDHNHDTANDTRYVNVTGDTMTGLLNITGAGNGVKIPDPTLAQNARIFGDRFSFSNPADNVTLGGLYFDVSNTKMTLQYLTGQLLLDSDNVVLRSAPDQPMEAANKGYVDTAISTATTGAAKKYALNAVGGATSQVITHNLNTKDVVVNVYRTATPWDTVECDVERTSTTTITLRFTTAPATNEYSVVVIG
jgi:hypothetical protein